MISMQHLARLALNPNVNAEEFWDPWGAQIFSAIHEVGLKELVLIGRLLGQREVTIMYDLKRMTVGNLYAS